MNREQCAETMMRVLPKNFKKFMKGHYNFDMPRQHIELLFIINSHNGQPSGFYCDTMQLPKSNISVIANKLVEAGLIVREPDADDRRVTLLKITEKGQNQIKIFKTETMKNMLKKLDKLSDEDVNRLYELILEINLLMEKANA